MKLLLAATICGHEKVKGIGRSYYHYRYLEQQRYKRQRRENAKF